MKNYSKTKEEQEAIGIDKSVTDAEYFHDLYYVKHFRDMKKLFKQQLETNKMVTEQILSELKTLKGDEINQPKKYRAILKYTRNLTKLAKDNSIIVSLDGDDWLLNDNVLNILNFVYLSTDCNITYGSFTEHPRRDMLWNWGKMNFTTIDDIKKNKNAIRT